MTTSGPARWWLRTSALWFAGLGLLATALVVVDPVQTEMIRIDRAQAVLRPEGLPEQRMDVQLRHRWDSVFPGTDGTARYVFDLPLLSEGSPTALLLERVGNQAEITVNDAVPLRLGLAADTLADANKEAHVVALPRAARRVQISIKAQALRGAGLSPVWIGAAPDIERRAARLRFFNEVLPAAYAASMLLMGGLSAGLWLRQREPLFGCFSLAALFGAARHIDHVLVTDPLPWPLWGALLAIAYGVHLALIGRFVLLAVGRNTPWLVWSYASVLCAIVLLAAASFAWGIPALWTSALGLQLGFGLICFVVVFQEALEQRKATVWFVLTAGTLLLMAGAHDLLLTRTMALGVYREPLAQHALFAFVLLCAGIVVQRFNASVAAVQQLNSTLAERVAERERQLSTAFEAIRVQREQEAAMNERQRITRDIHDGVGAHLVGLLSQVRQVRPGDLSLEQQVRAALDELRMAVDSLQPVHGDLATVLATLRFRLQPRLQAAGINVVWDVAPLPLIAQLSPQAVLHVQRILLEAFTNVIRHAQASTVTVRARLVPGTPDHVVLEVHDDGIGLGDASPQGGHGLRNMSARAEAIGARLRVGSTPTGGTAVVLEWPFASAAQTPSVGSA